MKGPHILYRQAYDIQIALVQYIHTIFIGIVSQNTFVQEATDDKFIELPFLEFRKYFYKMMTFKVIKRVIPKKMVNCSIKLSVLH